jgi:hypothetical protein
VDSDEASLVGRQENHGGDLGGRAVTLGRYVPVTIAALPPTSPPIPLLLSAPHRG